MLIYDNADGAMLSMNMLSMGSTRITEYAENSRNFYRCPGARPNINGIYNEEQEKSIITTIDHFLPFNVPGLDCR